MRRHWFLAVALASSLTAPTEAAVTEEVSGATRSEIASLVDAQVRAWNGGDAEAFAARALPDIVFTNIVGMFTVGKAPFVAQHRRIFTTIYRGSTVRMEVQHVTAVKPDVAIVDLLTVLTGTRETPPGIPLIDGAIRTRLEEVLVRTADGWRVASFHNVAMSPVAAGAVPPR